MLDLITVAYRAIAEEISGRNQSYGGMLSDYPLREFLKEVQAIFTEENVHYEVDVRGGVHHEYDKEFARSKAATIDTLRRARYANILDAFNRSMEELGKSEPDRKHAKIDALIGEEGSSQAGS